MNNFIFLLFFNNNKIILLCNKFFSSLGGPFPEIDITNPHNDEIITTLMRFLELRIQKRNILQEDLKQKRNI